MTRFHIPFPVSIFKTKLCIFHISPAGRAIQNVLNLSTEKFDFGLYQTTQDAQLECEACQLGYYKNKSSLNKTELCNLCPQGSFSNQTGATVCLVCPAGTCQDHMASNSCKTCPWWDVACGGSVCLLESSPKYTVSVVVIVQLPTSKIFFLSAQEPLLDALSLLLNVRRSQVRVSDVEEVFADRRTSSVVTATLDIVMSSGNCSLAKGVLTESNMNQTMKAIKLPGISSMSASYSGCDTQNNQSTQPDTLSIELRQQITSTTVVVASVVSVVVSGSVAGAVAGSLGVSISSSAAAPGASVYQLIDSVQFLNIYGSMFKTIGRKTTLENARRTYASDDIEADLNATSSQAADFR